MKDIWVSPLAMRERKEEDGELLRIFDHTQLEIAHAPLMHADPQLRTMILLET